MSPADGTGRRGRGSRGRQAPRRQPTGRAQPTDGAGAATGAADRRSAPPSPRASCGARRRPPTRSRARPPRTARARRSGTRSATSPGGPRTVIPGTSRATATTGWMRTWPWWPGCPPAPTASPSPGRGFQPEGRGSANPAGLAHYSRVVDALLDRGITPVVTLYHWDLPQALQDKGGWATRDTTELFADFAGIVAGALGDRVRQWITVNEPWVVANMGYRWGQHAPGIRDPQQAVAAAHHLLLGHGRATAAVRAAVPGGGTVPGGARGTEVGITLNMAHVYPADPASPTDRELAADVDAQINRVFLDPLVKGSYPARLDAYYAPGANLIRDGDLATIQAPIDFLGVNYYAPHIVGVRRTGSSAAGTPRWGRPARCSSTPRACR